MNTPKFSIIVPVYNSEKYLSQCINSILCQSFPDFELLLINDGSTDNSLAKCLEYANKDKRVKVFNIPNSGVSIARNLGLSEARGKWITFVDSDDELLPDALSHYLTYINESDIGVIKAGYYRTERDTNKDSVIISREVICFDKTEAFLEYQKSGYLGFLWNTAVRADIAKRISFDENISWCEDILYVLETFKLAKSIVFSSRVVYRYFYNTSISNKTNASLSVRIVDPMMVMDCANKEKIMIEELCGNNCKEVYSEVSRIFQYKTNYAVLNAIRKHAFGVAINIMRTYSNSYCNTISFVIKEIARMSPVIRKIYKLFFRKNA